MNNMKNQIAEEMPSKQDMQEELTRIIAKLPEIEKEALLWYAEYLCFEIEQGMAHDVERDKYIRRILSECCIANDITTLKATVLNLMGRSEVC